MAANCSKVQREGIPPDSCSSRDRTPKRRSGSCPLPDCEENPRHSTSTLSLDARVLRSSERNSTGAASNLEISDTNHDNCVNHRVVRQKQNKTLSSGGVKQHHDDVCTGEASFRDSTERKIGARGTSASTSIGLYPDDPCSAAVFPDGVSPSGHGDLGCGTGSSLLYPAFRERMAEGSNLQGSLTSHQSLAGQEFSWSQGMNREYVDDMENYFNANVHMLQNLDVADVNPVDHLESGSANTDESTDVCARDEGVDVLPPDNAIFPALSDGIFIPPPGMVTFGDYVLDDEGLPPGCLRHCDSQDSLYNHCSDEEVEQNVLEDTSFDDLGDFIEPDMPQNQFSCASSDSSRDSATSSYEDLPTLVLEDRQHHVSSPLAGCVTGDTWISAKDAPSANNNPDPSRSLQGRPSALCPLLRVDNLPASSSMHCGSTRKESETTDPGNSTPTSLSNFTYRTSTTSQHSPLMSDFVDNSPFISPETEAAGAGGPSLSEPSVARQSFHTEGLNNLQGDEFHESGAVGNASSALEMHANLCSSHAENSGSASAEEEKVNNCRVQEYNNNVKLLNTSPQSAVCSNHGNGSPDHDCGTTSHMSDTEVVNRSVMDETGNLTNVTRFRYQHNNLNPQAGAHTSLPRGLVNCSRPAVQHGGASGMPGDGVCEGLTGKVYNVTRQSSTTRYEPDENSFQENLTESERGDVGANATDSSCPRCSHSNMSNGPCGPPHVQDSVATRGVMVNGILNNEPSASTFCDNPPDGCQSSRNCCPAICNDDPVTTQHHHHNNFRQTQNNGDCVSSASCTCPNNLDSNPNEHRHQVDTSSSHSVIQNNIYCMESSSDSKPPPHPGESSRQARMPLPPFAPILSRRWLKKITKYSHDDLVQVLAKTEDSE